MHRPPCPTKETGFNTKTRLVLTPQFPGSGTDLASAEVTTGCYNLNGAFGCHHSKIVLHVCSSSHPSETSALPISEPRYHQHQLYSDFAFLLWRRDSSRSFNFTGAASFFPPQPHAPQHRLHNWPSHNFLINTCSLSF